MKTKLTIEEFRLMFQNAASAIKKRATEFSELDAALGDGDHGEAMTTAFAVIERISTSGDNFKAMLSDMGFGVMLETSGSTSTLLGALLLGMSDFAPVTAELVCNDFQAMLRGGLHSIQKNTKADIGDKTMMDALIPAVTAAEEYQGEDLVAMLEMASQSAILGAQATRDMVAKFGRARNLGEKTIGCVDAGATSWASIIETFYNTIKEF